MEQYQVPFEIIKDPASLERIKLMFSKYTLDDAIDFSDFQGSEWISFERNGSIYTLCYAKDKLKYVTIEPV